MNNKQAPCV